MQWKNLMLQQDKSLFKNVNLHITQALFQHFTTQAFVSSNSSPNLKDLFFIMSAVLFIIKNILYSRNNSLVLCVAV